MTEQERARQCEMARARWARFNVRHGRPGHLPSHEDEDQDQEGEDQDREMDDEDREPREGEDQEEEEEVWEVAEPPIPVPEGKYKLLNNLLADTGE